MKLSFFTGEKHSKYFKRILSLAEEMGFIVRVYESYNSSQFDFLQAVFRDTVTIVDATIPDDFALSTVYPLLTAHVNVLDHILVFSDKQYSDGTPIIPLNITPKRMRTNTDKDLLTWLRRNLDELKRSDSYHRFEIESIEKLADYKEDMEKVMSISLGLPIPKKEKKQVMISYRNSSCKDVEIFKNREEAKGNVEVKVLPPGSLCDDYEAHTPMRRWMLVGLLENHIRSVEEVWVYYNDMYAHSWWTLAEMVMVAYINHGRKDNLIKVKVYDANKNCFIDKSDKDYPLFLHLSLTDEQYQKISRLLSNTRPDTMGPETLSQIAGMKKMAWLMRFMTRKKRLWIAEQMRPMIEEGIPSNIENRDNMIQDLIDMYSDPQAIMKYANDDVFKKSFWNNLSYQTTRITEAYQDGILDVNDFIDTPMRELTKFAENNLRDAIKGNSKIKIRGEKYYINEGKKRYLWLATRMGDPTIKDAPGIEIIQTYNLLTHNQIVGLVMKRML